MEAIESSCGVTIHTKEDKIIVLGLRDSVQKAADSVHRMIEDVSSECSGEWTLNGWQSQKPSGDISDTTVGTGSSSSIDQDSDSGSLTPTSDRSPKIAGTGEMVTNEDKKEEQSPKWARPILHFFKQLKAKDAPYESSP